MFEKCFYLGDGLIAVAVIYVYMYGGINMNYFNLIDLESLQGNINRK